MPRLTRSALFAAASPWVRRARPKRRDLLPSLWDCEVNAKGELTVGGHSVLSLTEAFGAPLHVVHVAKLLDNVRRFNVCRDVEPAACRAFYSYKTNPVHGVLQILHAQGVGAEVISPYELWLALELGVKPEDIVFNGPGKTTEALRVALERGVGLINCNHRGEIAWVADQARLLGKHPRVGLRISTGLGWGGQFGTPLTEAVEVFREALQHKEIDVVAIHSHLGRPIRTITQLYLYLDCLLTLCDVLWHELRFHPSVLDIGGSLAVPTVSAIPTVERRLNRTFLADLLPPNPRATMPIEVYVRAVHERVKAHFVRMRRPPPTVYMEPGRAMTGNAQLLALQVMSIKQNKGEKAPFAVLNGGINLADACRVEYHQLFHAQRMGRTPQETYRLAGPICTPGDVIYWSWRLPRLAIGDCLAIMDSGAYFVPFSTSFSYPQPAIVAVEPQGPRLLRRHETFADMHERDNALDPGKAPRRTA